MIVRMFKDAVIAVLKRNLWKLPNAFLEKNLAHAVLHRDFAALLDTPLITGREDVWANAAATVGVDSKILYLEFGVFEGYSIGWFSRHLSHPESRFYGFDSFEGLPEDWGNKPKGTFSTRGLIPAIEDTRVHFVKGWFHDTLPDFAADGTDFDAVIVHMDAGLYSSTLFVLSQLWAKYDSFHVIFDEFISHECRALYNFSQACPCEIIFRSHDEEDPTRVLCQITRQR